MARRSQRPRCRTISAQGVVAVGEALSAFDTGDAWHRQLLRGDNDLGFIGQISSVRRILPTAPSCSTSDGSMVTRLPRVFMRGCVIALAVS
jgi:hypothetical protein